MKIWKSEPPKPDPAEIRRSYIDDARLRVMLKLYDKLEAAIDAGRYADAGQVAGAIGNLNRR